MHKEIIPEKSQQKIYFETPAWTYPSQNFITGRSFSSWTKLEESRKCKWWKTKLNLGKSEPFEFTSKSSESVPV